METVRTPTPGGKSDRRVARWQSRGVDCPLCGAVQGEPCKKPAKPGTWEYARSRRYRKASHRERQLEYLRLHPLGKPAPLEPAADRTEAKARMLAAQQKAHDELNRRST